MVKIYTYPHINLLDFEHEHNLQGLLGSVAERYNPANDTSVVATVSNDEDSEVERQAYSILISEYGFTLGQDFYWDISW